MNGQTTTIVQTNDHNNNLDTTGKRGRPVGSSNIHSKHPSSIAIRLKLAGVNWIDSFAVAVKRNDKQLLTIWLRLLPYLVVTGGHRRVKRSKGRASKAALEALAELEQE